jgi:hypothetical protein
MALVYILIFEYAITFKQDRKEIVVRYQGRQDPR